MEHGRSFAVHIFYRSFGLASIYPTAGISLVQYHLNRSYSLGTLILTLDLSHFNSYCPALLLLLLVVVVVVVVRLLLLEAHIKMGEESPNRAIQSDRIKQDCWPRFGPLHRIYCIDG